jgi:hypothetical protein
MAHFPSCLLSIPDILTTSTMSSPLLVVALPLLSCRHILSISRRAASSSQRAAACCSFLLPVAPCLLAHCHVASHCVASTLHHLLSCRRFMCPSSTPRLHLHRLFVTLDLVAMPPPPILLSTAPSLDALPPHFSPATPPPVPLLFAPTGCCIASCGTSTLHPLAHPPLCLCLLSCLILVCPG